MGVYEQLFDGEENMRMNCMAYEKKGRLEGMAEGRRLQNEDVATKLISMGMAPEDISEATGLTSEEIGRLGRTAAGIVSVP